MENRKKIEKRFLLYTIGQFMLVLGTVTIGSNFKALPAWLILFVVFVFIGCLILFISYITFYKVNRNYLRSFIAFVIYLIVTVFADACTYSKNDFYLVWSRGLETSAAFVLCVTYVYFFFGTYDYFQELGHQEGKKKILAATIALIVLFVTKQVLSFVTSLDIAKQNLVLFSICRFGSWGIEIALNIFIFVVLVICYVLMKKRQKEEISNEEVH